MPTVRIGATEHDLADVQEHPGNYVRALERAKTVQGFAECGCVTRSPRPKLVIRTHGPIFLLARWPDQAHLHSKDCPFLQRKPATGRAGSSQDAFQVRDGHHNIRLDLAMRVSTRAPAKPREQGAANASRSQRRSAGLLAFLEYAWEAAGLHVWVGGGPATGVRAGHN
jgi:hypothetical protein